MAKRPAETQTADATASASTTTNEAHAAAAVSPADAHDANLDNNPARGGSYVIEDGVRRLVERTEAEG